MTDRLLHWVKKEPLIHFLLLGIILYLINSYASTKKRPEILLTYHQAQQLYTEQMHLLGHPLSQEDSQRIINNYFENEILLHEAYRQGLDQYDQRIRNRLIEKMRLLLYGEYDQPNDDALRAYYNENRDKYMISKSRSFRQIFYTDAHYQQIENKADVLEQLNQDGCPGEPADVFNGGELFREYTRFDLIREFGMNFANVVDQADTGRWIGPVTSKYGVHFVRILEIQGREFLPYESVKTYLANDYIQELQQKNFQTKFDSLKNKYILEIEIEPTI